jgi:hypothetical protein
MPRALPLAVLSVSLLLKVLAPAHAAVGTVTPMTAPGAVGPPVKAAPLCHTTDGAVAAPSLAGMKAAVNIIESGDATALTQLMEQKRAMRLPAGMPVFVEDTFEAFYRVRPKGMTDPVWMHGMHLTCVE